MNNLIIIGGGGLGWELSEYIRADIENGYMNDWRLKGVIDDEVNAELRSPISLPYLGTVSDYEPEREDIFLLAIGNPGTRAKIVNKLSNKKIKYATYVHSQVYVANSANIKEGAIVCPGSIINSGAILEKHSVVNVFCSVGHGATVGKYSVLSPYSAINGDAAIGDECFMGTRATIFPRVIVGDNCTVDSHSYVKMNVENNKIITNKIVYTVLEKRIK